MTETPREIKDMVGRGEITPEQAMAMLGKVRRPKQEVIPYITPRDEQHFQTRVNLEEMIRHWVALPAVALVGLVDGALEAGVYGISEIAETASFGVSRTIKRFREGIERGKQ